MTVLSYGDWSLIVIAVLYVCGALAYLFDGKTAMFLVLACYAIANFGLILAANRVGT